MFTYVSVRLLGPRCLLTYLFAYWAHDVYLRICSLTGPTMFTYVSVRLLSPKKGCQRQQSNFSLTKYVVIISNYAEMIIIYVKIITITCFDASRPITVLFKPYKTVT